MTYSFTEKKRIRNNFGTRESILKEPDLLSIQINSFNTFIQAGVVEKENIGLHSVFQSVFLDVFSLKWIHFYQITLS